MSDMNDLKLQGRLTRDAVFKTKNGKQVAFIIRKGALEYTEKAVYKNIFSMSREEIIKHIVRIL